MCIRDRAKAQQVDLTNFEKNITDFKTAFSRNYQLASDKFKTAIDEIDVYKRHHLPFPFFQALSYR